MSAAAELKRRLRDRSEHYLMRAAVRDLGADQPGTVAPFDDRAGLLWRKLFVPLYRRVPWPLKRRAMEALRMTAQRLAAAGAPAARAVAPTATRHVARRSADAVPFFTGRAAFEAAVAGPVPFELRSTGWRGRAKGGVAPASAGRESADVSNLMSRTAANAAAETNSE